MLTLFERAAIPLVTRLFSGAYLGKYSIYAYDMIQSVVIICPHSLFQIDVLPELCGKE